MTTSYKALHHHLHHHCVSVNHLKFSLFQNYTITTIVLCQINILNNVNVVVIIKQFLFFIIFN